MSNAWVDASAVNDSGAGTEGDPKKVPDSGMALISSAGNTLHFKDDEEWTWAEFGSGMQVFKSNLDATEGSRITVTRYGSGTNLPKFNYQQEVLGNGSYGFQAFDCDWWVYDGLDIRNIGHGSRSFGNEGGGIQQKFSWNTEINNCHFQEIQDSATNYQPFHGAFCLQDSNVGINCAWSRPGFNVTVLFAGQNSGTGTIDDSHITQSNNQITIAGRGENIVSQLSSANNEYNECLGNETLCNYVDSTNIDGPESTKCRFNINYGDSDRIDEGWSQETLRTRGRGISVDVEPFVGGINDWVKHGRNHIYLNLNSNFLNGGMLCDDWQNGGGREVLNGYVMNKNSTVDCLNNWLIVNNFPTTVLNGQIEHNISMLFRGQVGSVAGSNHDANNAVHPGLNPDNNYFDTAVTGGARHATFNNPGDVDSSSLALFDEAQLEFSQNFGDVVIEDFRPTSRQVSGTLNNPDEPGNYPDFNEVANHDEFGALLEQAGGFAASGNPTLPTLTATGVSTTTSPPPVFTASDAAPDLPLLISAGSAAKPDIPAAAGTPVLPLITSTGVADNPPPPQGIRSPIIKALGR